jgi:hypothetical protein
VLGEVVAKGSSVVKRDRVWRVGERILVMVTVESCLGFFEGED